MKVLVVGGAGFMGQALVAHLLETGHEVEVWDRVAGETPSPARFRPVDLLGEAPLPHPEGAPWGAVFQLAARSVPGAHWSMAGILDNLRMTARVFDHLAVVAPGCRAILASSAFVYGPGEGLLSESHPTTSTHPYGLSKLLCEAWALHHTERLQVRIVRPFNLIGPGMPPGLLIPDLLARIEAGEAPLQMRGPDDLRDFLDWRDAAEAYRLMMEAEVPSGRVWNLCSGRPTPVSSLVQALLAARGCPIQVHFPEIPSRRMVGLPDRLQADTGWRPHHSLEETVQAIAGARTR